MNTYREKLEPLVILVAPNVTEQMGGEGIKALHIFQEMAKLHPDTIQITHERNRSELDDRLRLPNVYYVTDTWLAINIWKSVVFRPLLNTWFSFKSMRLAEKIAADRGQPGQPVVVWQTEPNTPVAARELAKDCINCFGPINGNIYYPPIFSHKEETSKKVRRRFHMTAQRFNRIFLRKLTRADLIFSAGGARTRNSLTMRGCDPSLIVDTFDCGIKDELLDRSRVSHSGVNYRFVHFRAGVFHKGTEMVLRSLPKTRHPIRMDIIGRGPEVERCKDLCAELGLTDRVTFIGWFESHSALFDSLTQYRGFVLPTIEDANGIAVQEALATGLPSICLDWGGPQLLVEHSRSGYLIEPKSQEYITSKIAEYMDQLCMDGELAEKMSIHARQSASAWRWSAVISDWMKQLQTTIKRTGLPTRSSTTGS